MNGQVGLMASAACCAANVFISFALERTPKATAGRPPVAPLLAREELPAEVRRVKAQTAQLTPEAIAAERQAAADAADELDRFLARGGRTYQADWRRYLRGREGEALRIAAEGPLDRLLVVRRQLHKGHEGLDLPIFKRLAARIDRLAARLRRFDEADQIDAQLAERLDALAQTLESGEWTPERLRSVAETVDWLEQRGIAPRLTRSLRAHYWKPNLMVQVSESTIVSAMTSSVDDRRPVCDLILGTSISGEGHTTGRVTARLVPSDERATIDTWFRGHTDSKTVGANGPARIFTEARTRLLARKRLFFTGDGFTSLRTSTEAETDADIVGIGSTKRGFMDRIVRRVASKRVAQSKGQSEYISARHAESLFSDRFDEQAGERLAEANRNYYAKLRRPLMNSGAFPTRLRSSTTRNDLSIDAVQAVGAQISAAAAAPEPQGGIDIGARLHETMIHNFTATSLAGRTIDNQQMKQWMIDTFGKLPKQLEEDEAEDRDPWSITFAAPEPVTVQFGDDRFSITIHGSAYTSGDNRYRAMDVTAAYRIERQGDELHVVREEDLKIYPPGFEPGKDRLSVPQQTLRRLLERRFGKVFTPELELDDIELAGDWKQIGVLHLANLQSRQGWLSAGWTRAPAGTPASARATWEPLLLTAILPPLEFREVESMAEVEALSAVE